MGYLIYIGILLGVLLSPAIIGAILRLLFRSAHTISLSIAIGVLLAILQAGFDVGKMGVVQRVNSLQERNFSTGSINVSVVSQLVVQIGIYAAIASLGIKLTDKLRGSQQKVGQISSDGVPPDELPT